MPTTFTRGSYRNPEAESWIVVARWLRAEARPELIRPLLAGLRTAREVLLALAANRSFQPGTRDLATVAAHVAGTLERVLGAEHGVTAGGLTPPVVDVRVIAGHCVVTMHRCSSEHLPLAERLAVLVDMVARDLANDSAREGCAN